MSLKSTEKILSTLYQREKELVGVYLFLNDLTLLTLEAKKVLGEIEREDKKHASFLRERLRQLGVEVRKLKEVSEKTINELREALDNTDGEEKKLDLLMKVLVKVKKSEIALFRSYLELKERDELSQRLLEKIADSETHHLLRLEALDLVSGVEKNYTEERKETSGDSLL